MAETPILWPPDAKSQLIGNDPVAGKDQRQKVKGAAEDEMVNGIPDSMDMNLSKLWVIMKDRKPCMLKSMGSQRVAHNLGTEQQQIRKR